MRKKQQQTHWALNTGQKNNCNAIELSDVSKSPSMFVNCFAKMFL